MNSAFITKLLSARDFYFWFLIFPACKTDQQNHFTPRFLLGVLKINIHKEKSSL